MGKIIIDSELCIGCGECVKDCVSGHLELSHGKAAVKDGGCIECGHCYAVCPAEAVSMSGYSLSGLDKTESLAELDSDKLLLALKSRRSIRRFKDKAVSDEDVLKIVEAGRYCPTASNAQDLHFVVLRDSMARCEAEAVALFRRVQRMAGSFSDYIKDASIDDNFFFKGAPLVILVAAKREVNAALASSYMEIMANSLGLGVLYSGFFVFAAKHSKAIKRLLDLPEGAEIFTCMVIGHSDVEYKRLAPRKAPNLILR